MFYNSTTFLFASFHWRIGISGSFTPPSLWRSQWDRMAVLGNFKSKFIHCLSSPKRLIILSPREKFIQKTNLLSLCWVIRDCLCYQLRNNRFFMASCIHSLVDCGDLVIFPGWRAKINDQLTIINFLELQSQNIYAL